MCGQKNLNYYGSDISVSLVHTKLEKMLSTTVYKYLKCSYPRETKLKGTPWRWYWLCSYQERLSVNLTCFCFTGACVSKCLSKSLIQVLSISSGSLLICRVCSRVFHLRHDKNIGVNFFQGKEIQTFATFYASPICILFVHQDCWIVITDTKARNWSVKNIFRMCTIMVIKKGLWLFGNMCWFINHLM